MLPLSIFAISLTTQTLPTYHLIQQVIPTPESTTNKVAAAYTVPDVPFYSQFKDVKSPTWQKQACGVVSLAMLIDYYNPDVMPSVNTLLTQAIASGAYDQNAGWTYKGLIALGGKYGLSGNSYDLKGLSSKAAFEEFKTYLADGPAIASIHYKFDPRSTIPHLIVIEGVKDDIVYYNDPAAKTSDKQIAVADFLKGWKKRFIVVRPTTTNVGVALVTKPDHSSSL